VVTNVSSDALVLFDIDGTLIRRSGPHHREALEYAAKAVLGVTATLDGVPTHGQLDTGLLLQILLRAGVPAKEVKAAMPTLIQQTEQRYHTHGPHSLEDCRCPGVPRLLDRLHARAIPMLVVTGNFPAIGWRKLELAGIRSYFRDGAFAGMRQTRAGLAGLAIRRALQRQWIGNDANIVLIGDSPNDILAAHANHIRSIAVATGLNSREDLSAHSPHLLLPSLHRARVDDLFR